MLYNNYYEEPKRIVFNFKKNGIKSVGRKESKKANHAQVLAQIATIKVNSEKMSASCDILKNINNRQSDSKNLLVHKIGNTTKLLAIRFDEINHQAKLEGQQISLILQIVSQLVQTVVTDKKLLKMILTIIRNISPKPPNNPGNGGGFNPGLKPPGQNPSTWSTLATSTTTSPLFSSTYNDPDFDWNSTVAWSTINWNSSTPPPFWNSTYDWSSTLVWSTLNWNSSTPPPFWNSTYDWSSTINWSTLNWNSSTPPPFWNSTYDWSSTINWSTLNWNSSTPPPFWNSTFDWSSTLDWSTFNWTMSTPPSFWNSTVDWSNFPFLNTTFDLNKTIDEIEEELSQFDNNTLQTILDSLDENSLYDLYEKMNGTNIADDIEEVIFDTGHDEEVSGWEDIFGDAGDFFRRKKRQTSKEEAGTDRNRPKDFEENIAPMMAMGLQGFLMMDGKDLGIKLPKVFSKLPDCLREILWESQAESDHQLCARIPDTLKSKLRELMMMVLKKEISPKFVNINWPQLIESLGSSGFAEELVKNVMSKVMVPFEEKDVSDVLALVKEAWKKIVDEEKDSENRAILNLVTDLITSLEHPEIVSLITEILKEIQGEAGQDVTIIF